MDDDEVVIEMTYDHVMTLLSAVEQHDDMPCQIAAMFLKQKMSEAIE